MKDLIYDGSFPGMLTALKKAREEKNEVQVWTEKEYRPSLFGRPEKIKTDFTGALEFRKKLNQGFPRPAYRPVFYSYLYEGENTANLILDYLEQLQAGCRVGEHVVNCRQMEVGREKVRMLGFIRFQLLNAGYYYAPLQARFNILGLLGPHFAARHKERDWVVHDCSRELAIIGKGGRWQIRPLPCFSPQLDATDNRFKELWREHFNVAAVPGRINQPRQNRLIPNRYWPFLTEKSS